MQFIPPFLSRLIDSVAYQDPVEDSACEWSEWKENFERYYRLESDYALSDHDAETIASLPSLLLALEFEVEKALQARGSAEALTQSALAFFAAHDAFHDEREKQYFVEIPSIDRLLKVTVSFLQGRAAFEAIPSRIPLVESTTQSLQALLSSLRDELPEALVMGTEDGIQRASDGLKALSSEADPGREVLEKALFELKSAGELLVHLPRLSRRFEDEAGSSIPIIGPILDLLRQNESLENVTRFREHEWPLFLQLWEARTDAWMLEPELAENLLHSTELEIEVINRLLESDSDDPDAFWDAVERLEDSFFQIRDNTLELAGLSASPFWPEAQLLLNLLRGGSSLYLARQVVQNIARGGEQVPSPVREVGQAVSSYLEDSDPLHLLRALQRLKIELESSKTTRVCPNCTIRIPLEAQSCEHCGVPIEQFTLSG